MTSMVNEAKKSCAETADNAVSAACYAGKAREYRNHCQEISESARGALTCSLILASINLLLAGVMVVSIFCR